uniref:ATP synthase subunit a n=1 Tax=Uzeldikra longiprocessa TaxID=2893152 RepID=A0A9E6XQ17_9HEMI|nr:ATP synthase F0 subunit 6 [Uzeldikra longiprocessa]UGN61294.1 ATP synthase F0 subunit 6 [Uzeldikra longiprocessa]
MTNLFSVFDPCTGSLSMNWISTLIFIMIMPYKYWILTNKLSWLINSTIKSLKMEMENLMPYKGSSLMFISIMMFILINNLMGLLPYVFTSSAHLNFSLTIALPLWLSFMLYGWLNKYNKMFSHLLPVGTPPLLMPFMIMIETISNIIRPGSLSVRLTANMIAGHLLMSLLGNNTTSIILMTSIMIIFITLMLFELAVAMIQAYVFMTLTTLYSSEVNYE